LRILQELLGHSTLQATQRYTHVGLDQLARTIESCHPLGSSAEPLAERERKDEANTPGNASPSTKRKNKST
jgi:hypothetical protein